LACLIFDTFKDPLYKLQRIGLKNYVSETAYSILASRMGMFYEKLIKVLPTLEVRFSSPCTTFSLIHIKHGPVNADWVN